MDDPTLFGIVAAVCSILGTALGILSHIAGRKNAAEEASRNCHENLLKEERLTEELSKQLRDIRLKYGEADEQ